MSYLAKWRVPTCLTCGSPVDDMKVESVDRHGYDYERVTISCHGETETADVRLQWIERQNEFHGTPVFTLPIAFNPEKWNRRVGGETDLHAAIEVPGFDEPLDRGRVNAWGDVGNEFNDRVGPELRQRDDNEREDGTRSTRKVRP